MELKETEKRLLEAVSHIVENDGFTKIGVNRIANQQIVKDVLMCQLNYLKDNALMQQLLVWELSGHSSFKGVIEERERIGHKLQEELNKFLDRSGDNNMSIAIIISAINYIVLFTRQYHKINGIDFSKPEAWERMEAMISKYVDFIFDNNCL